MEHDTGDAVVELEFTARAEADLAAFLHFVRRQPFGNPIRRRAAIDAALERLRLAPEGCRALKVVQGQTYRLLVVEGRILIPYIYTPGRAPGESGRISVRAIRHSAMEHPLRAVRETPNIPYGWGRSAMWESIPT